MSLPLIDDELGQDDTSADILGEVQLISFKAEPSSIGPFGASVLSWHVEGPPGFQLKLRGQRVQKTGDLVVQPASTTSFALTAHARRASRTLGHAVVTVDTTGCETFEPILNPKQQFKTALKVGVDNDPTVYFRVDPSTIGIGKTPQLQLPVVKFSPGRIAFSLRLSKRVDWFPNFLAVPSKGKRNRTVRIDDGNNGAGIIEVTACPYDLLKHFATISAINVVIQ